MITADVIRDARDGGKRVRVAGAGTWLDAGRPTMGDVTASLADDRGIVHYEPGDLTLTARAGTRIGELVAAAKSNGQWLPLDPWGGDEGTIGATISTATAGPHAGAMGLPRDVVLGIEFVSGNGDVVRCGGRVVKNVAGFDLTRLLVGSWGTLGVITEITVRLRARPAHTRTLALDVAASRDALNELAMKLRALPFTPLAAELVNPALAFQLGVGEATALLVRLGGNTRSIQSQVDQIRKLAPSRDFEERVWAALRSIEPDAAATWRWSQLPTLFGNTWMAAIAAVSADATALVHGSALRGIVRVISGPGEAQTGVARNATRFDGTVCIERLPRLAWPDVGSRPDCTALARAIRARFDPRGILNPGILGSAA